MPSTEVGRKLTHDEQAAAKAAGVAAPKDVWLVSRRPVYPEARRRAGKPRAGAAPAVADGTAP
jgi:hypothetical protein